MAKLLSLDDCLALCREAINTEGATQQTVLALLAACLKTCSLDVLTADDNAFPARALEQLPVPVINTDLAGYITGWNQGAETLYGYRADEAIGRHLLFLAAEDTDEEAPPLPPCATGSDDNPFEIHHRKQSGDTFWATLRLSPVNDAAGEPIGMVAVVSESLDRQQDSQTRELRAQLFEDCDQPMFISDAHDRIVSANTAFTRMTGYTRIELVGQTSEIIRANIGDTDLGTQLRSALATGDPWQGEVVGKRSNGALFHCSAGISIVRDRDGTPSHALSTLADLSVLRAAEARMLRQANFDPLTELPNRTLITHLIDHALAAARRNNDHGALLSIKLTRLAAVNDSLGHQVGDELLRQVARRLRQTLRQEDALARVGGDEFMAALFNIQKREHSATVAQKLQAALEPPFLIGPNSVHVGASIGISVYPEDSIDTATLLHQARVAMTRAHESGDKGYLFYGPGMNRRAHARETLQHALRNALSNQELILHYQPKASLRTGEIVGAEALIRWQHPERGLLLPAHFIPVAEETGLILELGTWVLDAACRQLRAWHDQGLKAPPVSINLSARQFDSLLPQRIDAALQRHGVMPERLQLEINENLLVRGADSTIAIMNDLAARGLSLALDDFGTGNSSLVYLKKFPITALKIDRSLIANLPEDPGNCALARALVAIGQQLRQEVIAEGVEHPAQVAFLCSIGCDQIQGFAFSAAVTADDFAEQVMRGQRLDLTA